MTLPHFDSSSLQPLLRTLRRARFLLAALLLLTVVLLVWQHYGMNRVVEISSGRYPVFAVDDRSKNGTSSSSLQRVDGREVLDCQIRRGDDWPYCSIQFEIGKMAWGVDLSEFRYLTIDLGYQGAGPATVRVNLVNFEPGYSKINEPLTAKYNEIDHLEIPANGVITVPLRSFSVARWWKDMRHLKPEDADARLDNVVRIELTSDEKIASGPHRYELRSLAFHGKWISRTQLLAGLVVAWIAFAIGWPVTIALMLRDQLKRTTTTVRLLKEINKALQLEARELSGQAHHDALTGALNREGLRAALMETSTLFDDSLAIMFLDLDHFKKINDQHGHDVGDQVLRQFARAMTGAIRATDRLVRWGGEEFLILCPHTDLAHATALAEKLRQAMHQQNWPHGLAVTASFGVAQHRVEEEIGAAIGRADAALYRAKRAGRDRVCSEGAASSVPLTVVK